MAQNGSQAERELRRQELERLATVANIHLRRGEHDQAAAVCEQILALDDRRATIHRALGDIRLAQGRTDEAKACYERALELAPGDAHTERQLALLALQGAPGSQEQTRMLELLEDPAKRQRTRKNVGCASIAALTFPGFGQIYNGDFLKGGVLFACGAFLLGLVVHLALINPFVVVAREAGGVHGHLTIAEQIQGALNVISRYSLGTTLLLVAALLLLTAIIVYGVWDAVKVCRALTAQDDRLIET